MPPEIVVVRARQLIPRREEAGVELGGNKPWRVRCKRTMRSSATDRILSYDRSNRPSILWKTAVQEWGGKRSRVLYL